MSHANFANLLLDIAVLKSLNIRVVLVHGAAEQIAQLANEQSLEPSSLDGNGITDDATLKLVLTAANGLTHEILEGFTKNDLRAANANAVTAQPLGILDGIDHQSRTLSQSYSYSTPVPPVSTLDSCGFLAGALVDPLGSSA